MSAPLSNEEAEIALLASVIKDPGVIDDLPTLVALDFAGKRNRDIFMALKKLKNETGVFDLPHISGIVSRCEPPIDPRYVEDIIHESEQVPLGLHNKYFKLIRDTRIVRDARNLGSKILGLANEMPVDQTVEELVDQIEKLSLRLRGNVELNDNFSDMAEVMQVEMKKLEKRLENPDDKDNVVRIPTGFNEIDSNIMGLGKGEVAIIAARPSVGKTAFLIQLFLNVLFGRGLKCGFLSLEMTEDEVSHRIIANQSKISWKPVNQGLASPEEFRDFKNAATTFPWNRLIIDDTPRLTIEQAKSKMRRMVIQDGVEFIGLDFLQKMKLPRGSESTSDKIGYISAEIKATIKELGVPGVILAQLNREIERDKRPVPTMSDLRASGDIEQDADHIWALTRPDGLANPSFMVYCLKGRNVGVFDPVELYFDYEKQWIYSCESDGEF